MEVNKTILEDTVNPMLRTCIVLAIALAALFATTAVVAEDQNQDLQPADNLQLMMDFAAENPGQSTLFLYKKSFNKDGEIALFQEQARTSGMNMAFREFYGSEVHKGRLIEEFRDAGYERVMFIGESAEAKKFVKEAGKKDWGPDFVVPSDYADELMEAEKLNFDGKILVAMNSNPQGAGGVMDGDDYKIELEKMRIEEKVQEQKKQSAAYGYNSKLCETSRRTGSRIKKRTCYASQQAKDARRQSDQEDLQRMQRGTVQAPPGG